MYEYRPYHSTNGFVSKLLFAEVLQKVCPTLGVARTRGRTYHSAENYVSAGVVSVAILD